MTDSLIAGTYELIGATTNPEYRLAPGWDFGEGVPDSATISSSFLDGDTVVGTRTGNRSVSLPVMVFASSRLDLASKIDLLRQAVAGSWLLQWTPDGGLPMVLDCYRATVSRVRDLIRDASFSADVKIECAALPFGRSPTQQSLTIAGQTQIDSFDTAPTGATLTTVVKAEGTGSAVVTGTRSGIIMGGTTRYGYSFGPVSRSFAAKDLSADQSVTVLVRWAPPYYGSATPDPSRNMTFNLGVTLTLNSSGGNSSATASVVVASTDSTWHLATFPVSAFSGTVNFAAVTSYSLSMSSDYAYYGYTPAASPTANVDDLRALPPVSAQTTTTRGSVLLIPSVVGSARTPVALAASGTINSLLAHRPPADQDLNAQILTGITVAASPSHPAASTVATLNAKFSGTYSAVVGISTLGPIGPNTVTVIITQLENAVSVATQTLTLTYLSPQSDRLAKLGEVTLPLRAVPSDNTTTTYTVDVNHTAGGDTYSDFMLLDTRGQTVIADPSSAVGAIYIDVPTALTNIGNVYASASGARTDTYGILDTALVSGGPFVFDPGNNIMLIWSDTSSPTLTTTYYPRWLDERVT